ncbi:unnamed protein product [Arabis nemorensis]|uniref:Legume lectin domain-containing protein n=1 Tax=Arabis nemorensis TaxID=586526 RepID=A0A565BJ76_9BRAS|nr:unnamed protein product [Arabis nemorensis]
MYSKTFIFVFFNAAQFLIRSISCFDFVYNSNFNTTNTFLVDDSTVTSPPSILTLTNPTHYSIGRGYYPSRISVVSSASPLPFATSFIVSMVSHKNMPYGSIAFIFCNSGFLPEFSIYVNRDICGVTIPTSPSYNSSAVAGFYGDRDGQRFTQLSDQWISDQCHHG